MSTLPERTMTPAAGNAYAGVSNQHQRTLDTVFKHPLAHNLDWHDVVALFMAIGGVEEKRSGEFSLRVGADHVHLNKPRGKDVATDDLLKLRALLLRAGWAPSATTGLINLPVIEHDAVIAIDHSGARLFRVVTGGDSALTPSSREPNAIHLTRELERNDHGKDREETYPKDEQLFERIALAIANDRRIVLVGHGHGQSNEAQHLSKYLATHHKDIHARIIQTIQADLSHLTTGQLLDLGRGALS